MGFSHHEPTFVHCEETLAQDAAAAPELHPEPAVRGGEGLRDFIATKPTWERKRQVRLLADSEKLITERGSGVFSMWHPVSRSLAVAIHPVTQRGIKDRLIEDSRHQSIEELRV